MTVCTSSYFYFETLFKKQCQHTKNVYPHKN